MDLSRVMMACGETRHSRAKVAAVMPGCASSSCSATYCAGVRPTNFSALLLARSIACSARLTSMPSRSSSLALARDVSCRAVGFGLLFTAKTSHPWHDRSGADRMAKTRALLLAPDMDELAVVRRIEMRIEGEIDQ